MNDSADTKLKNLEERLVAGAVMGYKTGPKDNSELYNALNDDTLKKLISVRYTDLFGNKTIISIDLQGYVRGAPEFNYIDIVAPRLINNENFRYKSKCKFLNTMFNSIFDDVGRASNYTPTEIMTVMAKIFNVNFQTESGNKIYISPETLRGVLNKVKKDHSLKNNKNKNEYELIKEMGTALIKEAILDFNIENFNALNEYITNLLPADNIETLTPDKIKGFGSTLEFDINQSYNSMPPKFSVIELGNILATLLNYDSFGNMSPIISGIIAGSIKNNKQVNIEDIKNELKKDQTELNIYFDVLMEAFQDK